jgi:putative tryptophan/tyrosine transport system substrate-binding protein
MVALVLAVKHIDRRDRPGSHTGSAIILGLVGGVPLARTVRGRLALRTVFDIPAAFGAAANARAEGVVITEESMFIVHRAQVTELAARYKLPTIYPFLLPVTDANGLMAFGVKASELYRSAAAYVDRILKGAKPSDLPVQQPTQFELVINLNVAKALAFTIPPTVLARATEVIE